MGLGGGGATVVVPMFLGEIADTKVRGLFGSLFQFTLVIAILVSQVQCVCPGFAFPANAILADGVVTRAGLRPGPVHS